MNQSSKAISSVLDDDDAMRRNSALDERLQRWAKWQLAGKPLARLGLPRQSTLAGIKDLQLTERAPAAVTVRARQSTVTKMLIEEEHWDEEITEQAVNDLGSYSNTAVLIIRAEYLWIIPILNRTTGQHVQRRIPRQANESMKTHRRRMAALMGRSLERYNQLLSESRLPLALLIEARDEGWIAAATSKS